MTVRSVRPASLGMWRVQARSHSAQASSAVAWLRFLACRWVLGCGIGDRFPSRSGRWSKWRSALFAEGQRGDVGAEVLAEHGEDFGAVVVRGAAGEVGHRRSLAEVLAD